MADFSIEFPDENMKDFQQIYEDAPKIFEKMTRAGAEVAYKNMLSGVGGAFSNPAPIASHLKITKSYRTYGGEYVNTKVAFYGYYNKSGKGYVSRRRNKKGVLHEYKQEGVPVPLIVAAREYGTSRGERKKPFVRKAFSAGEIESAMYRAQVEASGGLLEDE